MGPDDLPALLAGTADVVPEEAFREKLALERPLRVKLGVDPSRPDLTLGHTVVLRKLRQFQDAGHVAVLIIGDFTARIGDPSGRSDTRPMLSADEVAANARTYLEQAGLVIDVGRAEIRGNAEWSEGLRMDELLRLASTATVAQMLQREDFRSRYQEGNAISVVELLYPLFQGHDSVAVEADVELGGTDQTFNLLTGRAVQQAYGLEPQVVLTMPLLVGTDGVRKMSKSLDNYVALTDPPDEMFGKLMSMPDEQIVEYRRLTLDFFRPTEAERQEWSRVKVRLADGTLDAWTEKRRLGREIADLYHGAGAGARAEAAFDVVHKARELPEEVADAPIPREVVDGGNVYLPKLLVALGRASSKGEARRLIEQGGVYLDGSRVDDPNLERSEGFFSGKVLQVGRLWFGRLS